MTLLLLAGCAQGLDGWFLSASATEQEQVRVNLFFDSFAGPSRAECRWARGLDPTVDGVEMDIDEDNCNPTWILESPLDNGVDRVNPVLDIADVLVELGPILQDVTLEFPTDLAPGTTVDLQLTAELEPTTAWFAFFSDLQHWPTTEERLEVEQQGERVRVDMPDPLPRGEWLIVPSYVGFNPVCGDAVLCSVDGTWMSAVSVQ
jgi:hypothetical protein